MTGRPGDESNEQSPADDVTDHAGDMVDEAEEESFPASDPPTSWSGRDARDVDIDNPEEPS